MDNVFKMSLGDEISIIAGTRVAGVLASKNLYVLAPSSSRYTLHAPGGIRRSFCCQDGCCDNGLRPDVAKLVEVAKAAGAAQVILRTGLRQLFVREIVGLPVRDVSQYVGDIGGSAYISDYR